MGRSLAERWESAKSRYSLGLMVVDAIGKICIGLGIGIIGGPLVSEQVGLACLGAGIVLALVVKMQLWRPFWS